MLKPIPKRMLKDKVSYKEYVADTGRGSGFKTAVDLTNVKLEENTMLKVAKDGVEVMGSAMLFYDLVNSQGLTAIPKNESQVIYGGRTYHIINVDALRGNSTQAHHYEILLK